jgi:hypothetical protein
MRYHYADGIHPVECPAQHGRRCRICELTDPAHPDHNPAYLALYTDEPTGGASQFAGPGLLHKAGSFGKAIITHTLAGRPKVNDATHEARLRICRACMFFTPEPMTCLKCGCALEIKTRWADQACPIGKW